MCDKPLVHFSYQYSVIKMALHSFMMEYIPYNQGTDYDSQTLVFLKSGNIYDQGRKDEFCGRIKEWLNQAIRVVGGKQPIIVALAPGHQANSIGHGFLQEVVAKVVQANPHLQDGSNLLRRSETVPKATQGGPRDVDLHMATIQVTEAVAGRVVYILDDVWTTGATLTACERLVASAGASEIKLLAVAKTKHYL